MAKKSTPGKESLTYHPSKVSWATARFVSSPPVLTARLFAYVLVLLIIVAAAYAHLAQIPISVEARGQLITEDALLPVRIPVSLRVAELRVRENDELEAGDVIMVPQNELSAEDYEAIEAHYEELRELLKTDSAGECNNYCVDEYHELSERAFVITGESTAILEIVTPIRDLLRELTVAKRQMINSQTRIRSLQSRINTASGRLQDIRLRGAERMLGVQMEQLETEVANARSQIADIRGQNQGQVSQAMDRLEVRLGSLMPTINQYRTQTTVTAPIAGTVADLQISGTGQFLQAGLEVLRLIPRDSPLLAEIMIANKDIAQIQPGMEARIKLDALPEREFGTITGRVRSVPATVTASADGAAFYRVLVELDQDSIVKDGREYPFRLGMSATGLVITRYESLLQLGLRKLLNIRDEILDD